MNRIVLLFAALLAVSESARAEGSVAACGEFRTGWAAALRKLGLVAGSPQFGAPSKDDIEVVHGIAGIEARLNCREGIVGQLGLRAIEDVAKLEQAAASVLMALDRAMSPENATAMAAALRVESASTKREATSSWGPYELSWSAPLPAGGQFTLTLNEN